MKKGLELLDEIPAARFSRIIGLGAAEQPFKRRGYSSFRETVFTTVLKSSLLWA
jgi:hypothetical protein